MRNTIIGLLISLLVLLVYIASCGPQLGGKAGEVTSVEQALAETKKASAGTAEPEKQSLSNPVIKPAVTANGSASDNNIQRAQTALRASGFSGLTVQDVDGSLLLRGNVDSPADRVRAGRSVAQLGMPVINHVRAKQVNTAKPLALVIEKRNGSVSLRGDMTAAMHQSLKQRFSLANNGAVNETSISTPNASGAVQLVASAIDRMSSGYVRVTDTRVVASGESVENAQVFRTGLNRDLPRGFSLITDVRSTAIVQPRPPQQSQPVRSSIPIAKTVPVVMAEPLPVRKLAIARPAESRMDRVVNQPAVVQTVSPGRYQQSAVTNTQADFPVAKTYPLEPGDRGYRAVGPQAAEVPSYPQAAAVPSYPIAVAVPSYPVAKTNVQKTAGPAYLGDSRDNGSAATYPIAETYPLESTSAEYRSEKRYGGSVTAAPSTSEVFAVPAITAIAVAEPVSGRSNYSAAVSENGSIYGACDGADLTLMPNGSIRFFHNSAQLTHKARQRMEVALGVLQRCSQLKIEVAGHTDVTGADDTNGDISRARADRIALYLRDNGISAGRLRVNSYGDSQPAFSNDSKFGRAMNRRVELVIRR